MTPDHKAALAALNDAEQAVAAARAKAAELERAVAEQRSAVEAAYQAVNAAQMHADSFLPPVVIRNRSRFGADSRHDGVILRRTDKTVTVKYRGNRDETFVQFRSDKHRQGVWTEYPAPRGYSSVWRELEFPAS